MSAIEQLNTAERAFKLKYADGSMERYVARWIAIFENETWETGGPAKPLEGKFIDDRNCHWWVKGRIVRQVSLIASNGKEYVAADKTTAFYSDLNNQGNSFTFGASGLGTEDCGECQARRESDFNDMRNKVNGAFAGTVATDYTNLKAEFAANGEIVEAAGA